jgi:hypothetical protein
MFQPVVPLSGLAGWSFLQKTLPAQKAAFDSSAPLTRDATYFEAEIGKIQTAEELVADRRLLRVTLGAFGLQDDINSRYLIKTILEEGTGDDAALANRMSDPRYATLAEAFGFDKIEGPRITEPGFASEITTKYLERQFEVAVGTQDEAMRLALNAQRELSSIAASGETGRAQWYRILGTPPLRSVFETALGLPDGFGQLDVERQADIFEEKTKQKFGIEAFTDFQDNTLREEFIKGFLVREQIKDFGFQSSSSIALSLLQAGQSQRFF